MWVKSDNGYSKSYTDNLVLMSNAMTEPQWRFKLSSLRSVPRVANRELWIDPIAGLVAGAPAERIPARRPCFEAAISLAWLGVPDCPWRSATRRADRRCSQLKVANLLAYSLWLRTDA